MGVLPVARVVAVVTIGLLAGIFIGDRAGTHYARADLSPSSFVQFQQAIHRRFVRFMPFLVLTALLANLAWLFLMPSHGATEVWLVAGATGGIAVIAVMTRLVNVPLNNQLMTWSVAAPPPNCRELWAPWERVNTLRALLAAGALILDAVALSLQVSATPP